VGQRPASNHEENVIKDLLKKVYAEDRCMAQGCKEWRGVSEETDGRAPLYKMMEQASCWCRRSTSRFGYSRSSIILRLPGVAGRRD